MTLKELCLRPLGGPLSLSLLLLPALGPPTALPGQEPGPEARVDEIFAEMNTSSTPGCAVSVMREGSPVYRRGYGMANLEYGIPVTPSSIFHVASVSKQFTAFAVALLVDEGKISWEDDIRDYAPEVPGFGETITLRMLANHTSGIRDQWTLLSMAGWRFEADVITQGDVLEITSRQRALNFPPGERYLYSNTGFTLLAVVVERVTGQSLREFTQERIFEPLGMASTHFHDDHNRVVPNRAYAYAPLREGGYRLSIPDFDVVGATSLFTTVEDLARWDRNFYTAQVGGRRILEEMHRRGVLRSGDTISYALGLTHGSYRGLPTVGHGGSDAGYRSDFLRIPGRGLSVAVLCGFPASNPGALARRVADVYLEDTLPSPPRAGSPGEDPSREEADPVPLSPAELGRLEGHYLGTASDIPVRIQAREGRLFLGGGGRLLHQGGWVFRQGGAGGVVARFQGTGDGPLTLTVSGGPLLVRQAPAEPFPEALGAYPGRYWSEELGVEYEVRLEGEELHFWNRKTGKRSLSATFRDGFSGGGSSVTFTRGGTGEVEGFTLSSGRAWKVRFQRLPEPS